MVENPNQFAWEAKVDSYIGLFAVRAARATLYAAAAMLLVYMRPAANFGPMTIGAAVFFLSIPARTIIVAEAIIGALTVLALVPEAFGLWSFLAHR